jgi:hypothetical protein
MEGGGERAHGPTSDPCLASDCPSPDPSPSVYPKLGIYRTSSDTSTVALYADDFLLGARPAVWLLALNARVSWLTRESTKSRSH